MTLEELKTVNGLLAELEEARWLVSHTLKEGNTAANLEEAYVVVVAYDSEERLTLFPEELDAIRQRRREHVEELERRISGMGLEGA